MNNILIYGHGGALNHGSEALVLSLTEVLREIYPSCVISLVSHFPEQDKNSPIMVEEIIPYNKNGETNDDKYQKALEVLTKDTLCIFLAVDNLCYQNWQRYEVLQKKVLALGGNSVFFNASVDASCLEEEMVLFLKSFARLSARESETFGLLQKIGCHNVCQISDIAFCMTPQEVDFQVENFVAVNLSPLVVRKNPKVLQAFRQLLEFILIETSLNVVLIPHVLMSMDNDYDSLTQLQSFFPEESRITLVSPDFNCKEYKYMISRARFAVVTRTHASIAAYSTGVPTLVVGYSVKSKGIATDLDMLPYLLETEFLEDIDSVKRAFISLMANEVSVKQGLLETMKSYLPKMEEYKKFLKGMS